MNTHYIRIFIGLIILMSASLLHATKPVACVGVSKKCNKDVRTDKTIEGQVYSCYECKQTVCKSGGSGPIAGTETSSVFESKGPTSRSLFGDQQATQFDEADALFGKRSEVKGAHPKPQTTMKKTTRTQSVDNRKPKTVMKKPHKGTKTSKNEQIIAPNNRSTLNNRKNKTIKKKPKMGTKGPVINKVTTPTNVTLYDVTNNQLNISWMDNANNEYGVSVERGTPKEDRGGINYSWQHVFNVEERIDSNVKGNGWRTDGDDGLASSTEYCYRLRAYHKILIKIHYKTTYSTYSATVCASTK